MTTAYSKDQGSPVQKKRKYSSLSSGYSAVSPERRRNTQQIQQPSSPVDVIPVISNLKVEKQEYVDDSYNKSDDADDTSPLDSVQVLLNSGASNNQDTYSGVSAGVNSDSSRDVLHEDMDMGKLRFVIL